jgi:hypothetical protein
VLEITQEAEVTVQWFLGSLEYGAWGDPVGVKEWPEPGGVMEQDARLVQAVGLLLGELRFLPSRQPKPEKEQPRKRRQSRG